MNSMWQETVSKTSPKDESQFLAGEWQKNGCLVGSVRLPQALPGKDLLAWISEGL